MHYIEIRQLWFTIPKAMVATRHRVSEVALKKSQYVEDFVFCVRLAWYIPTNFLLVDAAFRKVYTLQAVFLVGTYTIILGILHGRDVFSIVDKPSKSRCVIIHSEH